MELPKRLYYIPSLFEKANVCNPAGTLTDYKGQGEQSNENIIKRARIILPNVTSRVRDVSQSEFSTRWTLVIHFANTRLSRRVDSRHTTDAFPLKAPRAANALESSRYSRFPHLIAFSW